MTKYLYGASVHGIQEFIFKANRIDQIIGASRIVDKVCNIFYEEYGRSEKCEMIVNAAGNVKCIFADENLCKIAVLEFPKKVEDMAPGINLSQAVVKMESMYEDFSLAVEELERRLQIQRNKPTDFTTPRLMGIIRSPLTNLPATSKREFSDERNKEEKNKLVLIYCDRGTNLRIDYYKSDYYKKNGHDSRTVLLEANEYDTIIHADANSLGSMFSSIGSNKEMLHKFSTKLNSLVKSCVVDAKKETYNELHDDDKQTIYINEIICSGDDLTVLCKAKYAIPFTVKYLEHFEKESGKLLRELNIRDQECLTACAGIAFRNKRSTFREGYRIANFLCERAKDDAYNHSKNYLLPSCLLFYKQTGVVTANFANAYSISMHPAQNHSFEFGPYYLKKQKDRPSIYEFMDLAVQLDKEKYIRKNLDDWVVSMYEDIELSKLIRQHKLFLSDSKLFSEVTKPNFRGKVKCYQGFDILTIMNALNIF